MVCMATNGAKQIKGGNWRIFASMLNTSSATLHLSTSVSTISKQSDNTYHLTTSSNHTSVFDEIILAAPLQYTNLTITPPPEHMPDTIPYTKLHTTLFSSPYLLDPQAFNLAPGTPVPQYVLTTLPATEVPTDTSPAGSPGFFSISIHAAFTNIHSTPPRLNYVYKIFSPGPVTSASLSHFLGRPISDKEAEHGDKNGTVSWIHRKLWHSYPKELPRVTFEEIRLDEGLWYTSGIESFISTMETSALSGRNVARLVRDGWVGGKEEKKEEVKKEWVEEL
jgi:prenylcysteine oxidase/farnesylcysteine lyase